MARRVTSSPCGGTSVSASQRYGEERLAQLTVQKSAFDPGVGGGFKSLYTHWPVMHCSAIAAFMGCLHAVGEMHCGAWDNVHVHSERTESSTATCRPPPPGCSRTTSSRCLGQSGGCSDAAVREATPCGVKVGGWRATDYEAHAHLKRPHAALVGVTQEREVVVARAGGDFRRGACHRPVGALPHRGMTGSQHRDGSLRVCLRPRTHQEEEALL